VFVSLLQARQQLAAGDTAAANGNDLLTLRLRHFAPEYSLRNMALQGVWPMLPE
jgi:hypothetical protein